VKPDTGRCLGENTMFKKRSSLLVLLLVALLASATPAVANGPEVYAYPTWGGNVVQAKTNESIHMFWGWLATTKGLVRAFVNHHAETYTLTEDSTGAVVWSMSAKEADSHWGSIVLYGPEWVETALGLDCPMPWVAASWWEFTVRPLEAGTYTLKYVGTYEQPVNDGFHACTELPGTDPFPTPSLYRGEEVAVSTIIVTP